MIAAKETGRAECFESCLLTLGEVHDESVYSALERLVQAGEEVGFTVHDLIRMLNEGMSLTSLLDVIELKMANMTRCLRPH